MHERLGEFAHCEVREVAVGACNRPGAGVREEGISDAYYATSPSEYTSDFTRVYVVCGRSWYEFAFGSKLVFYKPLSDLGVSAEYLAVIYYCCAKPSAFSLGFLFFEGCAMPSPALPRRGRPASMGSERHRAEGRAPVRLTGRRGSSQ